MSWFSDKYNNCIFVCKTHPQHEIEIFDLKTMKKMKTFGEYGFKIGQFNHPSDILVYNDLFYISDACNNRIQIFTLDGNFVNSWGQQGTTDSKLKE